VVQASCEGDGPPRCLILGQVPQWREVSRVTAQADTGAPHARIASDGRIVVLAVRMESPAGETPWYAWLLQPPDYAWVPLSLGRAAGAYLRLVQMEGDRLYFLEGVEKGDVEESGLTEWKITSSAGGARATRQRTLLRAQWARVAEVEWSP